MTHTDSMELENLLSAVTDALLADEANIDAITRRYDVPRAQSDSLTSLIMRLHMALAWQQPSDKFVSRLKQDLTGQAKRGFFSRLRELPARVQIAAAFALLAGSGMMLITRRRFWGQDEDHAEIPLLQQ